MKIKKILFLLLIILLFIFTMHSISYGINITFNDSWNNEQIISLSSELENRPYVAIFLFSQNNYNMISYVCCDYEFIVHVNKSNNNYKSIRVDGYSDNITSYSGSKFNLAYKSSSILYSSSEVSSFCNSLKNISFSNLTIPQYAVINSDIINSGTCIYSNFDLKTSNGDIYNKAFNNFSIDLSTTENTMEPIIAYSNYFNFEDVLKYECYISSDEDRENWKNMNSETFNDIDGTAKFRFNYKILKNGTYYFKLLNTETNEEKYITHTITNILKNSTNSGFNEYGIPQPFCTYEKVLDEFHIETQTFNETDIQKYKCLYTNTNSTNYEEWNEMYLGTKNNLQLNNTEYFFYFTTPVDSENCTYYFVFYDYETQQYGYPSSMYCDFAAMNEYCDKVQSAENKEKSRFEILLNFFEQRFGFLVYPFTFLNNVLNKFLNINFYEPIFYIPDIYVPFTNELLIHSQTFNLNSILENNTFKNIHNYYLFFVDAFVYLGIINLAKIKFKEVTSK